MLSRFTRVDREGNFSIEGDLRVLYSTMLSTRAAMLNGASNILLPAMLIGIRYSVVRRQFKNTPGSKKETVLLDYQTQQMKFFPIMARYFGMQFSNHYVNDLYIQLMKDVANEEFKRLELAHHFTAGMKASYTQSAHDDLLTIRQSLGGAGYSAWSSLPRLIEDYSPNVTFEGDNTVMAQQSCKYLLKMQKQITENPGGSYDPCFNYIKEANTVTKKKCRAKSVNDFLDLDVIEEALKVRVLVKLNYIVKKRDESTLSKNEFMNSEYAQDIV